MDYLGSLRALSRTIYRANSFDYSILSFDYSILRCLAVNDNHPGWAA